MKNPQEQRSYSGLVWILAGLSLVLYASLGLLGIEVPGVEQLVSLVQRVDGSWLIGVAFLANFIEGLYVIGNFVPGATLIALVAVLSVSGGTTSFILTVLGLYAGWCTSGFVNILGAALYRDRIASLETHNDYLVENRYLLTWYPSFRANYEVAQVVAGAPVREVLWSAFLVRTVSSIGAAGATLLIAYFFDITEVSNEEGFWSIIPIALISFGVGFWKMRG